MLKVESKINTLKIAWILNDDKKWDEQLEFYDIFLKSKENILEDFKKNIKAKITIT